MSLPLAAVSPAADDWLTTDWRAAAAGARPTDSSRPYQHRATGHGGTRRGPKGHPGT